MRYKLDANGNDVRAGDLVVDEYTDRRWHVLSVDGEGSAFCQLIDDPLTSAYLRVKRLTVVSSCTTDPTP